MITSSSLPQPVRSTSGPDAVAMLRDAIAGLGAARKTLPCKYLYDFHGSTLFTRICDLDAYYLTRAELEIMRTASRRVASILGPKRLIVEYGAGSGVKTRILLDELDSPTGYVPIDISTEQLLITASALQREYPDMRVMPLCADYTEPVLIPRPPPGTRGRDVFFPGSTIGNFQPTEALGFLRRVSAMCGKGGHLLVGVDTRKDRRVLERAYDDEEGVTAAFNLNLLARLNRELGADFDLGQFRHRARYDEDRGCVEMHLESVRAQAVRLDGHVFRFRAGETIHTESSYKYGIDEFKALAEGAGFEPLRVWTDQEGLFSVHLLWTEGTAPSHH